MERNETQPWGREIFTGETGSSRITRRVLCRLNESFDPNDVQRHDSQEKLLFYLSEEVTRTPAVFEQVWTNMFFFPTLGGLEELLEDKVRPGSAVSINCLYSSWVLSHHSVNTHLIVPFASLCIFLWFSPSLSQNLNSWHCWHQVASLGMTVPSDHFATLSRFCCAVRRRRIVMLTRRDSMKCWKKPYGKSRNVALICSGLAREVWMLGMKCGLSFEVKSRKSLLWPFWLQRQKKKHVMDTTKSYTAPSFERLGKGTASTSRVVFCSWWYLMTDVPSLNLLRTNLAYSTFSSLGLWDKPLWCIFALFSGWFYEAVL